ncbi:hypothetical protein GCM10007874_09610 [Labrys miyagiensis]|uniref:Uncharacterized protein n=1 Tax=Labrys miyagiensis TaxID=346912 RepID=A0ABQ6CCT1_9HYPH|nr:hypothetical protein [Labrys miyagiensis]GLS17945.1 hypothetical protein GCM10007874_09610 [Labrys miyagiensis]
MSGRVSYDVLLNTSERALESKLDRRPDVIIPPPGGGIAGEPERVMSGVYYLGHPGITTTISTTAE